MSRVDLRWIVRHPLRWIRAAWWHWLVAIFLLAKAVLITDPLWDATATAHLWPIILGFCAAMAIASSIALSDHKLQQATAVTLFTVAMIRAVTYGMLVLGDQSHNTDVLARAFALHWFLIAVAATRWPVISTQARLSVTVQAGEDALGRLREAG